MYEIGLPRVAPVDAAEEWVDARVHRPLAALVVAPLVATPVTPNQVTGLACLLGVSAAVAIFLAVRFPALRLLAGGLLFAAVVTDCIDGQLARARGTPSKSGEMLDGLADLAVSFSVLLAITYSVAVQYGDVRLWILGGAAMVSYGLQCSLFDCAKRSYLSRAGVRPLPGAHEFAQIEAAKTRAQLDRRRGEAFLLWFYRRYLESCGAVIGILRGCSLAGSETNRMRAWTWLGLGTHLALLYATVTLSAFWPPALLAALITFCTVQNALLVALLL